MSATNLQIPGSRAFISEEVDTNFRVILCVSQQMDDVKRAKYGKRSKALDHYYWLNLILGHKHLTFLFESTI